MFMRVKFKMSFSLKLVMLGPYKSFERTEKYIFGSEKPFMRFKVIIPVRSNKSASLIIII